MMIADLDVSSLRVNEEPAPVSFLAEAIAERRMLAAQALRNLQAWAGAYAVALESSAATLDDILDADARFVPASNRANAEIQALGAVALCQGVA